MCAQIRLIYSEYDAVFFLFFFLKNILLLIYVLLCFSVFCVRRGNGGWEEDCCSCCLQKHNSLLVMLQSRLHLSQLKSVFSHKQQSTAHKNSFCLSINNPLVLSPLHMCVSVCVCTFICPYDINNPLYSRQEHRVIHQFLHRKPISLEMFSFSQTHTEPIVAVREKEGKERRTHTQIQKGTKKRGGERVGKMQNWEERWGWWKKKEAK